MKKARKNFTLGVLSEGLWGAGVGFFLPPTLLPLALVDLGGTATQAGLLASLGAGFALPQAFSALTLPPRLTNPKPLALAHIFVILGPFLAGLGFLFLPLGAKDAKIGFLFLGYGLFAFGAGMMIPHYIACMGRCIPAERRGRFFGTGFSVAGLAMTVTGWLAARWAAKGGMVWGYPLCFLLAVPWMTASVVVLSRLRPLLPPPDAPPPKALRRSFHLLYQKLREPGAFRAGMVLTVLLGLASAPGGLFTVYLREKAQLDASWFQFFTPTLTLGGMVGALLLGYLVDHRGPRAAFTAAFAAGARPRWCWWFVGRTPSGPPLPLPAPASLTTRFLSFHRS